jgi:L-asparagine oxygenase
MNNIICKNYMDNSDYIIELNEKERNILTNIASKIMYDPSQNPNLFCKESKELSNFIPDNIKEKLFDFAKYGSHETGFLLFKNIPIDTNDLKLGKTPETNNTKTGDKTILAKIQSLLIHYISDMIAYEAEGYGRLFQDIVPIQSMATEQTSVGSNIELEVHVEQAFSNLRPDIISLGCLKGDKDAFTYILPVEKIIENVNKQENKSLFEPLWKTGIDLSFKINGNEFIEGDIRGPLAILNGSHEDPSLIFDQDLMFGITEESNKIMKKIIDIYYQNRIQHNLQPGEIILLDNNRAIHGRSSFFPKYDGNDRFLVRAFGTFNYEKSKYARPNDSRTISAIYS